MKKLLLSILLSSMLLSTVTFAQNYTCIDANTSYFTTTIIVSGSSIPISYNETCKFGCQEESGQCKPSPYITNVMDLGLLFGMVILAIIFFYLSFKIGGGEGAGEADILKIQAFKTYFFLVGLIFLLGFQLMLINYVSIMNKTVNFGFIEDLLWFILAIIAISMMALLVFILKDVANLIAQKKLLKLRW